MFLKKTLLKPIKKNELNTTSKKIFFINSIINNLIVFAFFTTIQNLKQNCHTITKYSVFHQWNVNFIVCKNKPIKSWLSPKEQDFILHQCIFIL